MIQAQFPIFNRFQDDFIFFIQNLFIIILFMKPGDKICHKLLLKSQKQLQAFKRREDRHIEGVPRIILGKMENGHQQIWLQQLKSEPIVKLKELNNGDKAFHYAKTIIQACCGLVNYYGFFMVNQNMIFFNSQKEVFVWINPDPLENHIKIYLPHNHDGELAMIRSIISYLKLWLKADYSQFVDVKHLPQLLSKLQLAKNKTNQTFKAKSPQRQFMGIRRNSVNLQNSDIPQRLKQENSKFNVNNKQMLMDSKSAKQICRSPKRQCDLLGSHSKFTGVKFGNNQLTSQTQKSNNFEHSTFNNNSTNNGGNGKIQINNSVGVKNGNYFPNKTTSNQKNSIVSLINKLDQNSEGYVKNKILLDEHQMKQQQAKIRKMKESLDGIGQEINDLLFSSNIENQQQVTQETIKKIQEEFQNILG